MSPVGIDREAFSKLCDRLVEVSAAQSTAAALSSAQPCILDNFPGLYTAPWYNRLANAINSWQFEYVMHGFVVLNSITILIGLGLRFEKDGEQQRPAEAAEHCIASDPEAVCSATRATPASGGSACCCAGMRSRLMCLIVATLMLVAA
eukprot:SAG22_NODE_432_length_10559_cov_29.404225_8_plen_148_part_00